MNCFLNLASSTDSVIDQSFVEISNNSHDDQENTNIDACASMADIIIVLNMDTNKLTKCNKKTATATARSVIKSMYPNLNSNLRYSDVDKFIVNSIIGKLSVFFSN